MIAVASCVEDVSYPCCDGCIVAVELDSLYDSNERDHGNRDSEHEPADTIRPRRVDVVIE